MELRQRECGQGSESTFLIAGVHLKKQTPYGFFCAGSLRSLQKPPSVSILKPTTQSLKV